SRSQEALPALTASKTHSTHAQVSALRSPRSTSRLDRLANHWITIAPPARRISAPAWSRKPREMDQSQGAAKGSDRAAERRARLARGATMSAAMTMLDVVNVYLGAPRSLGYSLRVDGAQIQNFARFADAEGHPGPLTIALILR